MLVKCGQKTWLYHLSQHEYWVRIALFHSYKLSEVNLNGYIAISVNTIIYIYLQINQGFQEGLDFLLVKCGQRYMLHFSHVSDVINPIFMQF